MSKTFGDFMNYMIEMVKENKDFDSEAFLSMYYSFVEPFAEENEIEVPVELLEIVDELYEAEEESDSDEDIDREECVESEDTGVNDEN